MRTAVLLLFAALSCAGQFRYIEIAFQGTGCASCIDSLPSRVQRVRGVETATVDAERGVLTVQLAGQNRVRLEQIRDLIEQDGSKATSAKVHVMGELRELDGRWILQPAGAGTEYLVTGSKPSDPGSYLVKGDVPALKPASGHIEIRAAEIIKK